jgi:hypothetical protein
MALARDDVVSQMWRAIRFGLQVPLLVVPLRRATPTSLLAFDTSLHALSWSALIGSVLSSASLTHSNNQFRPPRSLSIATQPLSLLLEHAHPAHALQ